MRNVEISACRHATSYEHVQCTSAMEMLSTGLTLASDISACLLPKTSPKTSPKRSLVWYVAYFETTHSRVPTVALRGGF